MTFDQPITFKPLYMQRIWGGRRLETMQGRALPPHTPIGESWELVDRAENQSVVDGGPHEGLTLHDLWMRHRAAVFGPDAPDAPRFPLLAKILDASDRLSVQVHPPPQLAPSLHGEPKDEMWYLLDALPGSELFAGFQKGVTRRKFESALASGTCAGLLHHIPVNRGDFIFIPSGRCHAIGGGCLIIEIQQNSDTTYRVFDWNRVDASGKPRQLHVAESLACIDFADQEPSIGRANGETLVSCAHFRVERWHLTAMRSDTAPEGAVFTVVEGAVRCGQREFHRGDFFLLPASSRERLLAPLTPASIVLRSSLVKASSCNTSQPDGSNKK